MQVELYDPSIHGDLLSTPEEEERLPQQSTQAEDGPSGSDTVEVEVYDPEVHGSLEPVDDRNLVSRAWDVIRPYTTIGLMQRVGDYISGPDSLGNQAFDAVVENAPGMVQDAVVGAVYEGPRRFLERGADIKNEVADRTVGPVLDWLGNQAGRATDAVGITTPEGRREYFENVERIKREYDLDNPARALPEYKGESEFATDVGATLGPAMAGAAVTGGIGLASGAGPWVVQGLRSIGAGIGFTAANEPGKNRTVIGDDALISIFPGLEEMDEEGRTQHLNVLFNDLMDAVGTAVVGDQVLGAAGRVKDLATIGIIKPAYALISRNADEIAKTQMYKLFGALNLARGAKTPNERAQYIDDAAQIVLDNARREIGDGASIKRDTMSAIEEGFLDVDPKVSSAARDVRSGHLGSGFDHKTREVVSDPSLKAQEYSRRTEDLLGGPETVDAGGEAIQRQAMAERDEILDSVRQAEANVSEAKALVDDLLSSDEAVRDTFTKLQKTDLNIDRSRYKTVAEMREGVRQAHERMSQKKQELFDAIQDPGPKDLSNKFSWAAQDDSGLPKDIQRMLVTDVSDGIVEMSVSPKELYRRVIPAITNHLDNIFLRGAQGDARPLLKLREQIYDEVSKLPGAEEFKNYYKKQWAPVWNSEHFSKFAAARRAYDPNLPVDFRANADEIIEDMLSNVHYSEQLHHFLKSPAGGKLNSVVPDYYMAQLAKNVQKSMNRSGKLDDVELREMLAPLEQFAAMIEKTDKKKFNQLNSFVERFRSGKLDIESLEKIVEETQKQADESIKALFNTKYKEFFDSQVQPLTGAKFQSFDELLRSKDASGRIPQILERAKATGNQEIIDGMKVAYLQHIRGRLFSDRKFIGTQRQMTIPSMTGKDVTKTLDPKHTSKEAADFLTDDSLDIRKIGRTIFEDSPETMDVIEALVRESDRISSSISHATSKKVVNFNDLVNQGSAALDKVITLTMGVLNRMAARSRAAKGAAVQWLDPRDQAKEIFDNIMANPEEFARVARLLAESERQKSSPEFRTAVRSMFILNGLDGDTADRETEAAFSSGVFDDPADAQTRTLFGDISDATRTVAAPINRRLEQDNTENLDWLTAPLSGKSGRLGE